MSEDNCPLSTRFNDLVGGLNDSVDSTIAALPARIAQTITISMLLLSLAVGQAAARQLSSSARYVATYPLQIGDVGSAVCGTGVGQILTFVLAAASVYFVVMACFAAMVAIDKKSSRRQEAQREGNQAMKGAGLKLVGAFVPVIFGGMLSALGINTLSCFNFDIGIATVVPVLF